MTGEMEFDPRKLPVRDDLERECRRAWERLASPGTWWDAAGRLAIAAEARHAHSCALCRRRKEALSPYTVDGAHDSLGTLPPPIVEVVHRVVTDAGRLTKKWLYAMLEQGVAEEQYVEAVGVIALITALDTFDLALGLPRRALPAPQPGTPSRHRPAGARRDLAWVHTVAPEMLAPGDPDPYTVHGVKNIHRALSLVPQEVINFFDLDVELYLKDHEIRDFTREFRALTHAQMELLAGRVSALNACYY
jgi:alkylhydroperoxidase family enzyme